MFGRIALLAAAAAVGFSAGWVAGFVSHGNLRRDDYPFLAERVPLPHHVPPVKGGAALRFAMVHDVLHERYPRHGKAYHAERVRVTRQKLAALAADDPAAFPLMDDLAVALDRLGRDAEAVPILDDKLRRQVEQKRPERELYTTYANLGTILSGRPGPRQNEGLALVRKSVEATPSAHFGRQRWQVEFESYRSRGESGAGKHDALGNDLGLHVERILNRELYWAESDFGRPTDVPFSKGEAFDKVPAFLDHDTDLADPARWEELRPIREHVTKVGPPAHPDDPFRGSVPFDEPTVAIVGLWRQVGGPDPHLALALGETMLRVGQRHVAWAAFERAARLAEGRWGPAFMADHCRARQAELERTMTHPVARGRPAWENVSPPLTAAEVAELRPRFEAELAHGEAYQRAYQEYEERQLAAGVPLDDPHFYDRFHTGREPIASPVGPEEWFAWLPPGRKSEHAAERGRAWGAVGAGLAALFAAALIRRRASARGSRR